MNKSPFKFLDSYTKEDKKIFFGRDKETEELYQKVFESKVLLVYGVSGTGKSSLIHCGLANKFNDSDWLPINIRRGANINDSLVRAIEKEITSTSSRNDENKKKLTLKKQLRNLYLDNFKPIYLIFDQFEELFIFGSKPEREDFIKSVKTIVDSDLNCKFLFVIREEYLAGITEFEKQLPQIMQNRIRIEKMGRSNAIQAIEGPCKYANINLEKGFSEALIEKLSPDSAEVELTYLQVYLDKLYKESENSFTLSLIDSFGDVKDLLGSFLDEQIAELESPEEGLTILKAFVSTKGTKRQITESEVTDYALTLGKKIESEQLRSLIQKFISLRILRDKDENNRYELRHDALAAKIYEKITLVEKELLEVRQFIENAYDNYQRRKILLNKDDLAYFAFYEEKIILNEELIQFVIKSKDKLHERIKTVKYLSFSAAILLILTLGLVYYYAINLLNEGKANKQALVAIHSSFDVKSRLDKAIDAFLITKSPETELAVFAIFNEALKKLNYFDSIKGKMVYPEKSIFDFKSCTSNILDANFSNDNKLIFGSLADSSVQIWDISGKEVLKIRNQNDSIVNVVLSNDNNLIAISLKNGTTNFWNIKGDSLFSLKHSITNHFYNSLVKFSADCELIFIHSSDNLINVYNKKGNRIQSISLNGQPVVMFDLSYDSRFISTISDTSIWIWYFNKLEKQYNVYSKLSNNNDSIFNVEFSKKKYYFLINENGKRTVQDINGSNSLITDSYDYGIYLENARFAPNEDKFIFDRIINNRKTKFLKGYWYNEDFIQIVLSNDGRKIAFEPYDSEYIVLSFGKNYTLELEGKNPKFSSDCKNLLLINNSILKLYIVDIDFIAKAVQAGKFFENQ